MVDIQKPELSWWNVTGASSFVLIAALVSLLLGTKLEIPLIISGIRCVVQLSLMGLVLDDVLKTEHMSVVIMMSSTVLFSTNKNKPNFLNKHCNSCVCLTGILRDRFQPNKEKF
ncbi:uncharacterized protein EV154DRAFT_9798 [Mucor mucedo]|uniref:uncharacterized protein n=1 Tax=Mucor mucedo TaxID=29922 RepID=UPI0022206882|nr:uncharacterized protein EV154DRAFT_9798 [Mucor mucedo]KAI7895622.1 hypothetical protein EV154DRAFT_9798 [Mucor mucedo]